MARYSAGIESVRNFQKTRTGRVQTLFHVVEGRYIPKTVWLPTQNMTRYKHGFAETVFVPSPIFHGKQCLRVLYTYSPSRYKP